MMKAANSKAKAMEEGMKMKGGHTAKARQQPISAGGEGKVTMDILHVEVERGGNNSKQ